VDRIVRRSLADWQPFGFEHRIVRPDGGVRTLSARGRLVLDPKGRPARMVGTGQDISEQKRAEQEREQLIAAQAARREAEEANRLKDEFLATLSHELRTPLSAIVGWGHVLQQSALGADARKAIAAVGRNAQALTRLIADLLDVSRAMSGRLALELRPTELRSVIQSALDTVRPDADAKSVRVELRIEAASSVVQADPERLGQVVWNLLSNAIKFSPAAGRVWVRVGRAVGGRLEIVVEDEGPGIAPDFLPHVFERFRQADPSTRRRHGGLGIGLAIVRNLVELHGGSVHAANRSEGRGAAFTVWLPEAGAAELAETSVPTPAGRAAEEAGAWQASAASLQGVRVLVIDDERDGREAIVAMLARSGAEVTSAGSAAEGLSAVQAFRPHVVLSDIQMPEEDGYAFLRKLRALPPERGGSTPTAALTAYAGSEARATALRAGFQAHIAKPVHPAELVASVATLAAALRD
jgi:signal transduction histidine kinase/CheY-like chemotaxis protein